MTFKEEFTVTALLLMRVVSKVIAVFFSLLIVSESPFLHETLWNLVQVDSVHLSDLWVQQVLASHLVHIPHEVPPNLSHLEYLKVCKV